MCLLGFPCVDKLRVGECQAWVTLFCWVEEEVMRHIAVILFSSVSQLCPTLCDPMYRSTLGLPVHHQLLEFTQAHAH